MDGIKVIKHFDLIKGDLVNPIAIIGCPGIADVGKFALDSLIGQLDAKSYIDIIFDDYPAGAIVDDSLLSAPKAEVLIWKDPKYSRDIVLITADAQSLTPKGIYRISNFLTEIIHQCGIQLILALGAYPINSRNLNVNYPKIFVSSTDRKLISDFINTNNFERIPKGVIIGANGLIPTLAKARFGIEGLVFLAETDNVAIINEDITDLKASIVLLEMLNKSFSIPLKSKYSLENLDDMTNNLRIKKEKIEKDLDSLQLIDADEKRKSLYI